MTEARLVKFVDSGQLAVVDRYPNPTRLFTLAPDADGYYQLDEGAYAVEILQSNRFIEWGNNLEAIEAAAAIYSVMNRLYELQFQTQELTRRLETSSR